MKPLLKFAFLTCLATTFFSDSAMAIATVYPPDASKRFAVSIGMGIVPVNSIVCNDAQRIHDAFIKHCGVEEENSILIVDKKATLANIQKIFTEELPRLTQPGDTILIYWSGTGGKTKDGKQVFLPTYNNAPDNPHVNMVTNEMFCHWIEKLSGRKVLILIDSCNSAGMATANAQTLSQSLSGTGQANTVFITSSEADEISFVRKDGGMSVFTYEVLKSIEEASTPLTHVQLYEMVKPRVDQYVKNMLIDTVLGQTVFMRDNMTEPLVLIPESKAVSPTIPAIIK